MRMKTTFLIVFTLILATAMHASAQFRGRGGDSGGRRGFDPAGMLGRMDANGNGQLDPDEMQGRARGFIERMAGESGLDMSKPIPISRLAETIQNRMRSRSEGRGDDRSRGGDDRRGRDDRGRDGRRDRDDRDRDDRDRDDRDRRDRDRDSNNREDRYPIVPGFGELTALGFDVSPLSLGNKVIALEKRYDRRILEMVDRYLDRYDRNRNSILDHSEWGRVRWRSDPRESDLNNDGRLTKAELAEMISKREQSERDRRGSGDRESSRSSSDRSRGGGFSRGGFAGGRGERGPRNNSSAEKKDSTTASRKSYFVQGSSKLFGRYSYRLLTPDELLPKEVPDQFFRDDENGDGQITFAEFPGRTYSSKIRNFNGYDLNRDGIITSKEWLKSEKLSDSKASE